MADTSAELAALGVTDEELARLASLYDAGQSLWRVPISHFTPWDCNWPYGPPPDATDPGQRDPRPDDKPDDPDKLCGSVIEVQGQVLGESIPITGTPFSLNYSSDRAPGRLAARHLQVTLSGSSLPASVKRVVVEMTVGGQNFSREFAPSPNLKTTFEWDGRDAYGRTLQGAQPVRVRLGYVYDAVYMEPVQLGPAFGLTSGVPISSDRARQEVTLWQDSTTTLGSFVSRASGLGGWDFDVHNGQVTALTVQLE